MLTGSGESDFATVRSAAGLTVVVAVAPLLEVSGSNSAPATPQLFVMVPPLRGRTVTVTVLLSSTARLCRSQVTIPPLAEQPVLADTKSTPAGKVSVTTTPLAGSGPLLVTVIV